MYGGSGGGIGQHLMPRLISSVPNNVNLKFGKNAQYLTHFTKTRKPEIRIPACHCHYA
jgi:hypothetical protein